MQRITLGFHDIASARPLAQPIAPGHSTLYTLGIRELRDHLQAIDTGAGEGGVSRVDEVRGDSAVLLTFDDGAASSFTRAAPELERFRWPGHFFVTTDWIGRRGFLNRQQIRELHERGHLIGSHSCSHPRRISHLGWADLVEEWRASCGVLGEIIGQCVRVASVPGGFFTLAVARAAALAGIEVLFTSEPTLSALSVETCQVLGRYSIRHDTPPAVSGALAAGAKWPWRRQSTAWTVKKAAKGVLGETYFTIRRVFLAGQEPFR
ncbi:MAG TPA: polysaccharide deacetylase family protein [Bryobacteraceae bacterium]|nr:polysaccharide deacetylase family protein [Bryobacteraceae bacterium]